MIIINNLNNRCLINKTFLYQVREQLRSMHKDNKRVVFLSDWNTIKKITQKALSFWLPKRETFIFITSHLLPFDNGLMALLLRWSGIVENKVYNDHYSTNFIRKYFHFHAIVIR